MRTSILFCRYFFIKKNSNFGNGQSANMGNYSKFVQICITFLPQIPYQFKL